MLVIYLVILNSIELYIRTINNTTLDRMIKDSNNKDYTIGVFDYVFNISNNIYNNNIPIQYKYINSYDTIDLERIEAYITLVYNKYNNKNRYIIKTSYEYDMFKYSRFSSIKYKRVDNRLLRYYKKFGSVPPSKSNKIKGLLLKTFCHACKRYINKRYYYKHCNIIHGLYTIERTLK